MSPYLLDTSALAAHLFQEDGGEIVGRLISDGEDLTICILSLFELHFLLKSRGMTTADVAKTMTIYEEIFSNALPIDANVMSHAIRVREGSTGRLPLADALVAGCAISRKSTLVCKDAHFRHVSEHLLKRIQLPERRSR